MLNHFATEETQKLEFSHLVLLHALNSQSSKKKFSYVLSSYLLVLQVPLCSLFFLWRGNNAAEFTAALLAL